MAKKTTQSFRTKTPKAIARIVLPGILRNCGSNKEIKSALDSNDLGRCLEAINQKRHLFSRSNAAVLTTAIDILASSSLVKSVLKVSALLQRPILSEILKVAKPELSIEFHEAVTVESIHTGLPRPVVWYRYSYLKENKSGKSVLRLRSSGGRKKSLDADSSEFSDYALALDRIGTYRNSKHRLHLIDEELLAEIVFGFEKIVARLVSSYEKDGNGGKSFSRVDRAMQDLGLPKKRNQLIADLVNWRIGLDQPSESQSAKQDKQMKFTARQIENRLNHKNNKRLK